MRNESVVVCDMPLVKLLSRLGSGVLKGFRTVSAIAAVATLVGFATVGYNIGPGYYWLILTALIPAGGFFLFRRALIIRLARIRAQERWLSDGTDVERVRHTRFEQLRHRYGEYTRDDSLGFVDDRTWNDLAMDEIHEHTDVCFTTAGRNELYRILRHSLPPAGTISERLTQSATYRTDEAERERIAGVLSAIGEEPDADPAALLWGDGAKRDKLYPLFVCMAFLAVASIVTAAAIDLTVGLASIGIVFLVNMWIYFQKAKHVSVYIPALRVLSRMIGAADELPRLGGLERTPTGARQALGWLLTGAPSAMPSFSGDIVEMFFLYIKIFFQIDLLAYDRIIRHVIANREDYQTLYQALGSLDAIYALASYRARRDTTCDAVVTEDQPGGSQTAMGAGSLHLEGVYHPLVEDAVANTVTLARPGAIVTGTNMAGKSTFLRTVGINVLFAQTAGFAFAGAYRSGRFRVFSSIDKRDDLAEGKSFYFDEAERIYRMIEEVKEDVPALLLIDELLSGTNSLERESASIAILHYLSERNALTIAATHDVTIAAGVRDRYALFYFTDRADDKGLTFDFKIQQGVVKTRNAIKLLRLIGYPEDVIRAALDRTARDGGELDGTGLEETES
jgi:MutS-like protein